MVQANLVKLWPKQFTISNYHYMLNEPMFFDALLITVKRVLLGWATIWRDGAGGLSNVQECAAV